MINNLKIDFFIKINILNLKDIVINLLIIKIIFIKYDKVIILI